MNRPHPPPPMRGLARESAGLGGRDRRCWGRRNDRAPDRSRGFLVLVEADRATQFPGHRRMGGLVMALAPGRYRDCAGFAWLEAGRLPRWLSAARAALGRRVLMYCLGLSALRSLLRVRRFSGVFRYGSYLKRVGPLPLLHGTKYASEVGYTHLYGATLAADHNENGLRYRPSDGRMRDLTTARMRDVRSVLDEAPRYRGRFGESALAGVRGGRRVVQGPATRVPLERHPRRSR